MFHKDSRDPGVNQLRHFALLDSCCYHQHLAREPRLLRRLHELPAIVMSEVIVQQDDVHMNLSKRLEGLLDRPARSDDFEARLCSQEPRDALAEKRVIIYDQNRDRPLR
jgi:hypothetical protein